jgi:hypothetical protein
MQIFVRLLPYILSRLLHTNLHPRSRTEWRENSTKTLAKIVSRNSIGAYPDVCKGLEKLGEIMLYIEADVDTRCGKKLQGGQMCQVHQHD